MGQVTIQGSRITPSTFLKPGARVTVEHTPYVDKLIQRGYVELVRIHESPKAVMEEVEQAVEAQRSAAAAEHALTGAPARNALTEDWRIFLKSKGFTGLESATRAEMIEAWEANRGESVD